MINDIKAIETVYKGITFRSRLEARWAVFFDQIGIKWVYEHEGYETPMGRYVPDFWLPDVYVRVLKVKGVYFEVKSNSYDDVMHRQLEYVCTSLKVGGILAKEFPMKGDDVGNCLYEIAPDWDNYMEITKCPHGHVKIDFSEYSFDDCIVCGTACNCVVSINQAVATANQYRFW